MTIPEHEFRRQVIRHLERIADALEAANRADPMQMIAAALAEPTETVSPSPIGLDADMPPYIKHALGIE